MELYEDTIRSKIKDSVFINWQNRFIGDTLNAYQAEIQDLP